MQRRTFLAAMAAAATLKAQAQKKQKVAIFSKHLQFLQGDDLARTAAELGFDGIDITVRAGGHVLPERVAQDLPPLVKTIRAHGLEVPMITTDILDPETPHAEAIINTMTELDIHHYRWAGFKYDTKTPLPDQLAALKPRIAGLEKLNRKYNAGAMYHTHSGINLVGAPIWDLYILLKDFDPKLVGVNYDIGHATIEGGFGGWIDSFRICGPYLQGIAVKDCIFAKNEKGDWHSEFVPIGEGMVKFPQFFQMVAAANFQGPLQLHFEYPLGGAENGKTKLTIPQDQVLTAMKRDLQKLRQYLA
jgi:sugar phosphate isomerase/epimerase